MLPVDEVPLPLQVGLDFSSVLTLSLLMILCVDPASKYHFTQDINYYPMQSGRELRRENAFTELSPPGAQTIVLGPLPPPTLPPHVRTSTLPPGHPHQSYGTGAFPPSYNIPGASSSNSNSGVTPGIAEKVASAPSTQPVSALSLDSSKILRKSSCDDLNEETTRRPSRTFRIEAPSPSLLDETTETAALAPTLAPSGNGECSSDSSSRKKRTRDDEEDEEEIVHPPSRMPPASRSSQSVKKQKTKKLSKKK